MPLFISYSHEDADFAEKLARQLVRHRTYIWLDKWELHVGDSLIQRIQGAIDQAPGLIVVLSKAAVLSEWCKKELESGLIRELDEKRVVVFPVVKDDCELPLFVRGKLYADFRKSFDDGLRSLIDGIAKVASSTQGKVEHPDFHTDWAVDWVLDPHGAMRLILLEHSPEYPYSCFTEVQFNFDEPTSGWFVRQHDEDQGEAARLEILGVMARRVQQGPDIRFRLTDQFPQTLMLECRDPGHGIAFLAEIASRRLGTDTGRDVIVDVGSRLVEIYESWQRIIRPPEKRAG